MRQAHSNRFNLGIETAMADDDNPRMPIMNPSMLKTNVKRAAAGIHHWLSSRQVAMPSLARFVIAALGSVVLTTGPVIAAEAGVRQIDIADYRGYLTDGHPVRQGMRKFAELVHTKSEGGLYVNVQSGALGGSPLQQIAALQAGGPGTPALMLVAATAIAALSKEFELLDLPFLVRNETQADALLDGAFGHALLTRLASNGLVGLAWWENGFRQITTSGRPIRRASDMQGLNFRVIDEPVFVETVRAMGANPVPLPFAELYAALKTKRVEAQDNFISQILAGRLFEVQSSLSLSNHSYSALVLVANAAGWNDLTASQQSILQLAAIEAGRFQRQVVRVEASEARAKLASKGMLVNEVEASELTKLHGITEPVRKLYFGHHQNELRQLYEAEMGRVQ